MLSALAESINENIPPFWHWRGLWLRVWLFWSRTRTFLQFLFLVALIFGPGAFLVSYLVSGVGDRIASNINWLRSYPVNALGDYLEYVIPALTILTALFVPQWLSVFTTSGSKGFAQKLANFLRLRIREEPASLYRRFGKEYAVCLKGLLKVGSGLTIMIDDLDRCLADRVAEVLELINMLSLSGPAIVILGIDRQKVEDAITLHRQDAIAKAAGHGNKPTFISMPLRDMTLRCPMLF